MMRRIRAGLLVLFLSPTLSLYSQSSGRTPLPAAPVNPHSSAEARALLNYLYSISGKYTLAGQHNYPYHIARWTDRVYDLTGKYPALYGQDFGFSGGEDKDSTAARPVLIAEAKRQYENGAVVTLTWHAVRPTDDEPVTFRDSVQGHLTDFEWSELLTPGTELYKRWCDQVDVVAGFLKRLQSAHVPVLFRPYHEMNGGWFWWGGRPGKNGSQALYRQLFDRFVNYHKLNNLVWVWNINAPSNPAMAITNYFPGREYADLLTEDIYSEFQQGYYEDMLALAAGKPIALGEVGALPTPEILQKQPNWTYFMVWSEWIEMANPLDRVQAVYHMPSVLGRSDPAIANAMSAIRKSSSGAKLEIDPVTPDAASGVRRLLSQLYSVAGTAVLSGQQNAGQIPASSTARVFEVTAKFPSIYGQDLGDFSDASALLDEAKKQFQNRAIVSLSWHAPRPSDGKPAGEASDPLTDYEWEQLLTPGTKLYERWAAQVDAASETLKKLQDAGISVLWRPYAEMNGKNFWWAGRKGNRGSAALYRQLFERMVNHNGVRNVVWVWTAAPPGSSANGNGALADFFPGLLYADAISIRDPQLSWRADATLALMGVGKPIGVELSAVPKPEIAQQKWSWFLVAADPSPTPEKDEALRALYGDARVLARSNESQNRTDAAK
ncbi:MAG TPA: glycosyl hydrolase [Terriglobales bacterium]|nr:glycosyl hydrolase [Terriglobales bacterium]